MVRKDQSDSRIVRAYTALDAGWITDRMCRDCCRCKPQAPPERRLHPRSHRRRTDRYRRSFLPQSMPSRRANARFSASRSGNVIVTMQTPRPYLASPTGASQGFALITGHAQADVFGFDEEAQGLFAAFAAYAALLHAPEAYPKVGQQPTVHPHRAALDSLIKCPANP